MFRILSHVVVVLFCVSALSACGDNGNPIAPTPVPVPMPEPTPEPTPTPTPEPPPPALVSLAGTVKSNTGNPLSGATVTILDGVNTGKVATTINGAYRFDGLTVGNGNLAAKAVGYEEARAGVYINGVNTLDFVLKLKPPEVIDPKGSWRGSGTGTASDGSPVSVIIELEVSTREVETWVVRYKIGGCQSTFKDQQNLPILGNSFEGNWSQSNLFLYTPTVFKGKFVSATEVSGAITLVSSGGGCPASATIEWSGTKR